MIDNEIRLKIAELKGWKFYEMNPGQCVDDKHPHGYDGIQFACKPGDYPDCTGYGLKVHEVETVTRPDAFDEDAPDWPTDIAAAWELVEEARQSDVGAIMHNSVTLTPVPGIWSYTCAFYDPIAGPLCKTYSAEAETPARAICLAWLKWKGVEV